MKNNNKKLSFGAVFISGIAALGVTVIADSIYKKYFKGKSAEEIDFMIDKAFETVVEYAKLANDINEVLRTSIYNLQNGYINLSMDNIDPTKVQKLVSIANGITKTIKPDSKIAEPIEIINEALKIILAETKKNS